MNFAQRLQKLMKKEKMNKSTLAKHIGVSPSTVTNWLESSILPNMEHMRKLADTFCVTMDYLLGTAPAHVDSVSCSRAPEERLLMAYASATEAGKLEILRYIESRAYEKEAGSSFAESRGMGAPSLTPDEVLRLKEFLKSM